MAFSFWEIITRRKKKEGALVASSLISIREFIFC